MSTVWLVDQMLKADPRKGLGPIVAIADAEIIVALACSAVDLQLPVGSQAFVATF